VTTAAPSPDPPEDPAPDPAFGPPGAPVSPVRGAPGSARLAEAGGDRVEALVGRALGDPVAAVRRPAPPAASPAPRRRARAGGRGHRTPVVPARPVLAGAIVVALALGAVLALRGGGRAGAPLAPPVTDVRAPGAIADGAPTGVVDVRGDGAAGELPPALATLVVEEPGACVPRGAVVRCDRGDVTVEYAQPPNLAAAYALVAPDDGQVAHGPAACAAGRPDERAWSWPETPAVAAGRYHCALDPEGRPELWWTDTRSGLLARARAARTDLAGLFAWWLDASDP
jgi:hypothetical protein